MSPPRSISAVRYALMIAACPPILVNSLVSPPLLPTSWPMPFAAAPHTANRTAYPAAQPASAGHCSRHASANGPRSAADAVGRPGRSGSNPAPRSRRLASENASQVLPKNSATGSASTHQRSPANGRRVSVQPSGSTQVSQDGPLAPVASPTARARNATPSTPIARPRAARAPEVSWAATRLTPVNDRPQVPIASASAADPAAGKPRTGSTRHSSATRVALASTVTARADVSGACRPTLADLTSSRRPASSSPLVCLTTRKTDISAANSAPQTPYRQAVRAPTESPFSRP